jgi:hypothetical protein
MKSPHYLATAAMVAVALSSAGRAADDRCQVRLALQLTPDAAATSSPGFLTSLIADPRYSLTWIRGSDTTAIVDLSGPGNDGQCQQGMDLLSRSAHVVSMKAVDPGTTESQ